MMNCAWLMKISSDFTSVGVSGVDHSTFVVGRPYGGRSIRASVAGMARVKSHVIRVQNA